MRYLLFQKGAYALKAVPKGAYALKAVPKDLPLARKG